LIIAHRLSTIRNADKIIVMHTGEIVEEGDHESLMRDRGTYFSLVEQQNIRRAEEEEQLAFEQNENVRLVMGHQTEENQSDYNRKRTSTVVSLTPSVMAALYGKNKTTTTDEDDETAEKKIKVKK
jgi:ABC-type glutathione transport system ATPase component